jgi:hypothetical protein
MISKIIITFFPQELKYVFLNHPRYLLGLLFGGSLILPESFEFLVSLLSLDNHHVVQIHMYT